MAYTPHDIGSEAIVLAETERTVEVNYYGEGQNPLVFLHGFGSHPVFYERLFDAMVQEDSDIQIVAPCGPGIGKSSLLLKNESIIDWPIQFMKATGITNGDNRSAEILGHSFGGFQGLHVADKLKKEEDIDAVVVTLATPLDKIEDIISMYRNLFMDTAISDGFEFGTAMLRLDFSTMLRLANTALATSARLGLTTLDAASEYQSTATQLLYLPESPRRQLFNAGHAQALFGRSDQAVRRPKDRSWPGIHETDGSHAFPVQGDPHRRALHILDLFDTMQYAA